MRQFLFVIAATFLLTSCRFLGGEKINGNGNIVTAQRNVGNFNSIEAGGSVEVRVKQDAATSVRVETDENLLEFLDVTVDGKTLVIQPRKGYNLRPSNEVVVYVSAPQFRSLHASGATKIFAEGTISGSELELGASGASEIKMEVAVQELQADLSGASSLQLKGSAASFSSEASGASNIRCLNLNTEETTLDVSGASKVEVTANKQLNIEASGASNIAYRGNASINQKSSGASSVKKIS